MWLRVMPGVATSECCLVWVRVLPGVGASDVWCGYE